MARRRLLTLFSVFCAAALMLAACGEDSGGGSNGNSNGNGDTDTGTTDTGTDDGGEDAGDSTDDATDTADTNDEGCTTDDDCPEGLGLVCDESTNDCVTPPSACETADPPPRCSEDPDTFTDWAPASVITTLEMGGWDDANNDGVLDEGEWAEENCCFDFDGDLGGDEEFDNGLGAQLTGGLLSQALTVPELNQQLEDSIADGSLIIVLEHQGLEDLEGDDFVINFLLGELTGTPPPAEDASNPLNIDPQSFDQGTYPQAQIPGATLDSSGGVTTGAGFAQLQLSLAGADISLAIRAAQIEATVPESPASGLDGTGVFLIEGKLGGYATLGDLFDAINGFAKSSCDCYGLGEDEELITYDPSDPGGTAECTDVDTSTCGDGACSDIQGYCDILTGSASSFADLDLDQDGTGDAISIGMEFEAAAANIEGVVDTSAE